MRYTTFIDKTTFLLIFCCAGTITSCFAVNIKPFQAIRPNNKLINLIANKDYNTLSLDEAKKIAETSPYSFVHIARPEANCALNTQAFDPVAALKGSESLQDFLHDGLLHQDDEPMMYLYGRIQKNVLQVGLICLVDINEYINGNIKKHEEVIEKKREKLTLYTELQRAQVDPIILLHNHNEQLATIIRNTIKKLPNQGFYIDNTAHLVWKIRSPKKIADLCQAFQSIKTLYIADGHHRTAAAASMKNYNKRHKEHSVDHDYCMASIFSFDQVNIYPYYRIFKDLNNENKESFIAALKKFFDIKLVTTAQQAKPKATQEFGLYCQGSWYKATLKKDFLSHRKSSFVDSIVNHKVHLDINILGDLILKPLLNIDIYHPDHRTVFVSGASGPAILEKQCKENNWPLGIAFFAINSDNFSALLNQGEVTPPKTTWFEPKIRPGLFTYRFECCRRENLTHEYIF